MQLGVVTEFDDVPLDAVAWNAIVARCDTNTVFQTYEWFDAWWHVFGSQHQLYFVWVKQGDEIVAFAPLMLTVSAFGLRKLEFTGSGNADYLDFCIPQESSEVLAPLLHFLQQRDDWDVLRLAELPMHSRSFANLPDCAHSSHMKWLHEATAYCPTLLLTGRADQARAMIDKYSVRRKVNWFSKHGKLQVQHLTDVQIIESHLDAFFSQHTQRWQRDSTPSQFERSGQRDFFKRLTRTLGQRGALVFTVITLGEESLAYHFGFDYGGRILWYKPSFNERYAGHSPGVVLMRSLIEEALRTGKDEFDYTVGAEAFKFRFSNAVRSNVYVSMYRGWGRFGFALTLHYLRAVVGRAVRPLRSIVQKVKLRALQKTLPPAEP